MKKSNKLVILVLIVLSLLVVTVSAQSTKLTIVGNTANVQIAFNDVDKAIKTFVRASVIARTSTEFTVESNNIFTYYIQYKSGIYTCKYVINGKIDEPLDLTSSTKVSDIRNEIINFISNEQYKKMDGEFSSRYNKWNF